MSADGERGGDTRAVWRMINRCQNIRGKERVSYAWWKNLREQPTVRVLLRGKLRAGRAEVFPEADGVVVVNIHLKE